MVAEALALRPTQRQGAWLVRLTMKVTAAIDRPPAKPQPRMDGADTQPHADNPPPPSTIESTTIEPPAATQWLTPASLDLRRTTKRQPTPTADREARIRWIDAVATARERAPLPAQQPSQPTLFSGQEVRVLVVLATRFRSWDINKTDNAGKAVTHDDPLSARELAEAAGVNLRTARRALARAVACGFLRVHRAGGKGRGRRSIYRLTVPHARDRRVAVQAFASS